MIGPNRTRLGTYEFFSWLQAFRPALIEGLPDGGYSEATRAVADRVGFRPAGAAETIGHYLAALQAFIAAPPPSPDGAHRRLAEAMVAVDPMPIQFAGPEPVAPRAPVAPFAPAFEAAPVPPRSAVARLLVAAYFAAVVRLRSVFSTTTPPP